MTDYLTPKRSFESDGVEDRRLTSEGACAFFPTGSHAEAARLVQAIGGLGGVEGHRPAVDIATVKGRD